MDSQKTQFQPYALEYYHDGDRWALEIMATSEEDALARCRQIYHARVLGVVMDRIPAVSGAGLLAKIICAWRNLRFR